MNKRKTNCCDLPTFSFSVANKLYIGQKRSTDRIEEEANHREQVMPLFQEWWRVNKQRKRERDTRKDKDSACNL